MKPILEIEDVSIKYHKNDGYAVEHVNFMIPEQGIVCMVGESGSGKSTLARGILGLLSDKEVMKTGHIMYNGMDLLSANNRDLRTIRGKEIAMIFQNAGQYLDGRRRIGYQFVESIQSHEKVSKSEAEKLAIEILQDLCMDQPERIMASFPFALSGGMCQRVAIAMAMISKPKLLIADEPTSALDVTIQAEVVRLLMQMKEQYHTSMLMVTHNMGIASFMADYIAVMKNGELVEFGTREQVIENPNHTYTKTLLHAVPKLKTREEMGYGKTG